jgi:serine/threonine-protein kinase
MPTAGAEGPPLRPGAGPAVPVIPGFEVLGVLGRGGMGVVYKARQLRLNRPCAVKMILAGDHASSESATRFQVEAETVARLHHPNIVQIYSLGDHAGHPYVELEFVAGGNLAQAARRHALAPPPGGPPGRGPGPDHGRGASPGVIHRDLKPANVLLTADGTPKITDFGLAKTLGEDSSLTQSGAIMGTPSYMAPEQAEGKVRQLGPAADIYALGAILYELVTGHPPFKGGDDPPDAGAGQGRRAGAAVAVAAGFPAGPGDDLP